MALPHNYSAPYFNATSPTVSTGYFSSTHASKPPSSGRTRVIPYFLRSSAARALVASFGQVQ